MGLPDVAIELTDIVVQMIRTLVNDDDPRDLLERINDVGQLVESRFPGDPDAATIERLSRWAEDDMKGEVEKRLRQLQSPAGQLFLKRAMGSKRYTRLLRALHEDGALVMLAARRATRYALPLIQALQDAAAPLPADLRAQFLSITGSDRALLQAALDLDGLIDDFIDKQGIRIDVVDVPLRPDEISRLSIDVERLSAMIRIGLRVETEARFADLSALLSRKLRGFEQALEHSDDGVSQAANSLIEFIDRLLRQTFDEAFVSEWAMQHFPDDQRLTFTHPTGGRPTKLAQALCFVHAGEAPDDMSPLRQLLAEQSRARSP